MTRARIEPRSPRPLVNSLPTGSMSRYVYVFLNVADACYKEYTLKFPGCYFDIIYFNVNFFPRKTDTNNCIGCINTPTQTQTKKLELFLDDYQSGEYDSHWVRHSVVTVTHEDDTNENLNITMTVGLVFSFKNYLSIYLSIYLSVCLSVRKCAYRYMSSDIFTYTA